MHLGTKKPNSAQQVKQGAWYNWLELSHVTQSAQILQE